MFIAIVTFDGFNEIDSIVAMHLLGRVRRADWSVAIASNTPKLTSMNGLRVHAQASLADARDADVVIVGSGTRTMAISEDVEVMSALQFDPTRQLVASQCSGALLLAKLGLLQDLPACTDSRTKPWVEKAGVRVLEQPFNANGNVATAGGCLASVYLATWVIARTEGVAAARDALSYVAPVGEKESYISHAVHIIAPYLPAQAAETRVASKDMRTA
jgi:transcriptional regulator GlxA family with amidase domain